MVKNKKKNLRIIIFLGIFLGMALIVSFLRINNMTGGVILEYTNETSCVNAGYTWEVLTEENCTTMATCVNETIENCECLEYEMINKTNNESGECINWESCINENCSEEQNCTDTIVRGQCVGEICDSEHLDLCFEENDCVSTGGYWYYNACHLEEGPMEDLPNETGEEISGEIINESEEVEQNITNEIIEEIKEEEITPLLTNEEREVLLVKFGNESVKITRAELVERGIEITFKLKDYSMIRFYGEDFSKEELNLQIEKDRVNWLKDIANTFLQNDNIPENLDDFVGEYPI